MKDEKFSAQDVAHLMVQCQRAIEAHFFEDYHFTCAVTDIKSHLDKTSNIEVIDITVKFDKNTNT